MRQKAFDWRLDGRTCSIAYTDWGDSDNQDVIVCVHGLTRNSRDFDDLAKALSKKFRVICPDMPGRGESDWLTDPQGYAVANYCAISLALMAETGTGRVDWVGTSMGGIIGMMLAAMPDGPIKRLIINDVGPFIPKEALQRIKLYLSQSPTFDDEKELETHLRNVHAPFGPLSDAQWAHLARHSARLGQDKRWRLKYDPAIATPFNDMTHEDFAFWEVWDAISIPTLLLRGAQSDLLLTETAGEMQQRGPKTERVDFAGVGHAPALMAEDQLETILGWLGE